MMNNSTDIPQKFHFSCSSDFIFLHDGYAENQSISYSDIALYSQKLPNWLEAHHNEAHIYILQSNYSTELCCLVAGLFLAGIPFCVVDPTWSSAQVMEATADVALANYLDTMDISALHTQWLALIPSQNRSKSELSLIVKNNPFAFLFTSGSSSRPKKIPLRYSQLWAAYQATQSQLHLSPNQSWGLCLPLHHIGALSIVLKSLLSHSSISLSNSSDVQCWNSWLNGSHNCRVVSMVPTQLHNWLKYNRAQKKSPIISKAFHFIILGGGPTNAADVEEAGKLGWPILLSYGMTETFAHICSIPASDLKKPLKDPLPVGLIHPGHSIRIISEEGDYDPLIWLMGTQIFTPESSQKLMLESFDEEGWFCTGDIGKMDENGLLYIQARRLDRIVSGGENVSVEWVIECLKQHLSVHDCAIIGIADAKWGQKVVAFIEPEKTVFAPSHQNNDQTVLLDEENELNPMITKELIEHCRKASLPASHLPKEFYYLRSLPRTSLGKLKIHRLQELHLLTQEK
tara:strand:+ start:4664 stop:6205 length:1542 start_codon:yes stop_codon:yes gene_type:complete